MSTGRSTTIRDRHRKAIARTKPPCGICGREIDYTITDHLDPAAYVVDHIIPWAKGGLDELANKQAAHRRPIMQPSQERPIPRRHRRHTNLRDSSKLVN